MVRRALFPFTCVVLLLGCGRLEEHVRHADDAYRAARYDDAEVWLERVEIDVGSLDDAAQTRFYFVRGMSAYRLGRRDEALHYLSLCRAQAALVPNSLPADDVPVLDRALEELIPTTMTFHAAPAPEDAAPALPAPPPPPPPSAPPVAP